MEIGHCSVSEAGFLEAHKLDGEKVKNPESLVRLHRLHADVKEGFMEEVTLELGLEGQEA